MAVGLKKGVLWGHEEVGDSKSVGENGTSSGPASETSRGWFSSATHFLVLKGHPWGPGSKSIEEKALPSKTHG